MSDSRWLAQPDPFLLWMHAGEKSVAGGLDSAGAASDAFRHDPLGEPVSALVTEGAPWADGQDDVDVVAEGLEEA